MNVKLDGTKNSTAYYRELYKSQLAWHLQ